PEWPQDGVPRPEWLVPAGIFLLIPASTAFLSAAWFLFRRGMRFGYQACLSAGALLALTFFGLHVWDLTRIDLLPQTNAYGSIFFVVSWMLDLVIVAGSAVV